MGSEKPSTAKPITARSIHEPAFQAAATPMGIASEIAITNVATVSEIVGSSLCNSNRLTGRPEKSETPKSPWARADTQFANCSRSGLSSPSFSRIDSTAWVLAWSPARTTAGSPGASLRIKNTITATIAITGNAESRRRTTYEPMADRRSVRLLDVPIVDARSRQHPRKGRPIRDRRLPLTKGNVGHQSKGARLYLVRQILLFFDSAGHFKGVDQVLMGLVARPADPGLLAIGVDRRIAQRNGDVGCVPPGMKSVPSTFRRRALVVSPGSDGRPIHRLQLDVEPRLAHQLCAYQGRIGHHLQVGR